MLFSKKLLNLIWHNRLKCGAKVYIRKYGGCGADDINISKSLSKNSPTELK